MSAHRSIVVHMREGMPFIFRGDIDAFVSEDGTLTVMDYVQRDAGTAGPVFGAVSGIWTHFCISPYVELKEAAA